MIKCSSLVLKVASRCNLNCTYCYMYNLGDMTYKNQPKIMSDDIVDAILIKTKNHCINHGLKDFVFIFHGGEPLLCGIDFFQKFIDKAHDVLLPEVLPYFTLQTNAVLIDNEWVNFFNENNVTVCCSLDGYKEVNDKNRVYHNGKGSFDDILKGINILKEDDVIKDQLNVLSVLNLDADPKLLLDFFSENNLDFDLLLLDANYDTLPYKKTSFTDTRYADWLCEVFDLWYANYSHLHIRFFVNIMLTILGKNSSTDGYGKGINEILVIETDGSIEAVDVLKICGDGFTKNGLNILKNEIDEAFTSDLIISYVYANEKLPKKCTECSLGDICGGGYLPHRYNSKNHFDNPSIYCHDLAKLITHIQNKIFNELPQEIITETKFEHFSYEDFLYEYNLVPQ